MNTEETYGKIVTDSKGALICPVCKRKIRGIRLQPGAEVRNTNVQCNWCKNQFDIEISAQASAYKSPRH